MPKSPWKLVFLGASSVGKTSIIEQIVYGGFSASETHHPTIDDIYDAWLECDRVHKERVRIYDTAGLDLKEVKVPAHFLHVADGLVLVFSVTCNDSFLILKDVKSEVEKLKGKEFPIVVLGTKVDSQEEERQVDHMAAIRWADSEQVKLFEVLTSKRKTLQEPVTWLVNRICHCALKTAQPDVRKIFRRSGKKDSALEVESSR